MFLSFLKGKSKLFLGVAAITSLASIGMWWYTGSLKEQVGSLESKYNQSIEDLAAEKKANDILWAEINRTNRIVKDTRQDREQIESDMKELRNALEQEKESNKPLQDCLSVDLGEYGDRLREQTASEDGSEKGSDP